MEQKEGDSLISGWLGTMAGRSAPTPPSANETIKKAAAEVMAIQDVTFGGGEQPTRVRGTLIMPAEEAFKRLRSQFEAVGHTPHLRHEEGVDVIRALPVVFGKAAIPIRMALILLVTTILSVFFVGLLNSGKLYDLPFNIILAQLTGNTKSVQFPSLLPSPEVWQAALVEAGLYALALISILGAHEMGHFIVARYNKVQTTLPFFIPMPVPPLGTMGAVIAMREPAPNRKVQFDIGIAGPLAGLIVAIPLMFIGLSQSHVGTIAEQIKKTPPEVRDHLVFSSEGQSLLYLGIKYLVFGEALPSGDRDVWINGVAFAAWAGFFVTSLNLIPVGQLDGGHILYGLFGDRARRARMPIIAVLAFLALAGIFDESTGLHLGFGWIGWGIWVAILLFMMRDHAPVLDEITHLDKKRQILGIVMLVVFLLLFMPTPLRVIVETPPQSLTWFWLI